MEGNKIEINKAMIATTTRTSIRVNARPPGPTARGVRTR